MKYAARPFGTPEGLAEGAMEMASEGWRLVTVVCRPRSSPYREAIGQYTTTYNALPELWYGFFEKAQP